jgi:hypothetical protein
MELKAFKKLIGGALKKISPYHQWYSNDPKIEIDPNRKKALIKNGFLPSDYLIFRFDTYPLSAYLNKRDYKKIKPPNGSFSALIDSKAFLPIIFSRRPELLPDLFSYMKGGAIKFHRGIPGVYKSIQELIEPALEKYGELIVKPASESGGNGIFKLSRTNFSEKLILLSKGEFILNNCLKNEEFLLKYYPETLNTTRVIFFRNSSNENEILMIGQRFGNSVSEGVDNVSKGGMACGIDLSDGSFTKAYSYTKPTYRGWFSHHVETQIPIEGAIIPDWKIKLAEIQRIVKNDLDFLEYGGMDLAFTDSGIKIIEINSFPGPQLMQVIKPALLNQEFKNFIISKGYKRKQSNESLENS